MPNGTRLGLLAYSSNTGLGIQTHEFAVHMKPDRVMLVDLSAHKKVTQHPERYVDFDRVDVRGLPQDKDIRRFLDGLDLIFVCETPLNYGLFRVAQAMGVKVVLQPNHEFNDYLTQQKLPVPDLFGLPSPWHYDDLPFENKILLPVPVARERFEVREDGPFRRFLHIAGRPAIYDRNGTMETIKAFKLVQGDVTLTVRVQGGGDKYRAAAEGDSRINIDSTDVPDYWKVYEGFDCLIMPRKYGGLCLPMQEALAAGLPVIMTDVSPNNKVLPLDWLALAPRVGTFQARTVLDLHEADVDALAAKLQDFAGAGRARAEETGARAREMGRELSWEKLAPLYRETFQRVVDA